MAYKPRFKYTNSVVRNLMAIENARATVEMMSLPDYALRILRSDASIRSTHHSTKIEGNILGLREVEKVVSRRGNRLGQFEQEVRNYWKALEFLEKEAENKTPITHELIRRLHRIIEVRSVGRRGKYSSYRTQQNTVKGRIPYTPPEPKEVQSLMDDLAEWEESAQAKYLPVPIRAGIFSYQFLTIHPFMDGNGRTARALATFILHREGYGLRGIFSVEDHYTKDINSYYENLQMGLPENYYDGRNDPDLTPWLNYFTFVVATAFVEAHLLAAREATKFRKEKTILDNLDWKQKAVLSFFRRENDVISSNDVLDLFKTIKLAKDMLKKYAKDGFLKVAGKDKYLLAKKYYDAKMSPLYQEALNGLQKTMRTKKITNREG